MNIHTHVALISDANTAVRDQSDAPQTRRLLASIRFVAYVGLFVLLATAYTTHAQVGAPDTPITQYYAIENGDERSAGDIVSMNMQTGTYHAGIQSDDESNVFFGVVVQEPAVYFRNLETPDSVPIQRTGIVPVNVSNAQGDIASGDVIVVSNIEGVGAKADENANHPTHAIVGVAQSAFPAEEDRDDGSGIVVGQILVNLDQKSSSSMSGIREAITGSDRGFYLSILKYVAAVVIAVGTVFIAYSNFAVTLRESVVSIGRNPLAKDSINRVVLYNSLLILLVLAIGFSISFAILRIQVTGS